MLKFAVVANENDNVATTVKDLKKDQEILVDIFGVEKKIRLNEDIPFGHKFAIKDIKEHSEIIKYGEEIGQATKNIAIGDYVHVHNVVSERGRGDLEVQK
ncbi:altronate dehydratase small subunit [Clostridium tetanomorphum]|uniref:UxaA family hydrolase n=1 Tax=Clostridium tetanomorphum TaxID=1553 RepID=A0A923J287_CLOTT|nr:UxaA family hydrolase [Clostridium tetanomorphum]KAJ50289.1 UxaA family hydrolase [Clostridium tetanomorphum DSM 665]MBC2400016.1 UxaA family hydrolase [Clostridium tetanomorphum]MBP1864544.1 altronate dehydratase small subunit [Clostridium tetanomorphum]NRS82924.1 altronate dehydratase small subunit [Clostridium tetanomorphum]NRZ98980.1 altronate dehydratase small subunit [Clostridium tetanomorphum]